VSPPMPPPVVVAVVIPGEVFASRLVLHRGQIRALQLARDEEIGESSLNLAERRSLRTVASASRLSGELNVGCVQQSLQSIVRRHKALRTRILSSPTGPFQHIDDDGGHELQLVDLTDVSVARAEIEAGRRIQEVLYEPFHVSEGPLFVSRLLKLSQSEHILLVALDHVVSDAASVSILWRDLLAKYDELTRRLPCALPEVTIQLADYARWQEKTHYRWLETHGAYWTKRLAGAEPVRLPADRGTADSTRVGWKTTMVHLNAALTGQLRELARRERTTLVITVYAAYASTLLSWCNRHDMIVPFEVAGRHRPELKNTIGLFFAPLLLRVEQYSNDGLLDLLRRVTEEYRTACEHDDSCRVAAQAGALELARNPHFNWVPQEFDMKPRDSAGCATRDGALRVSEYSVDDPESPDMHQASYFGSGICMDLITRFEAGRNETIKGLVCYRADRFSESAIGRFVANFQSCLAALASQPTIRLAAVPLEW